MTKEAVNKLKQQVKTGKIKNWQEVHDYYKSQGNLYESDKLSHAYTALLEILHITPRQFTPALLKELLQQFLVTRSWMCKGIYESRAKDYTNPFRQMVYESDEEMNTVIGRLEDNSFIQMKMAEVDHLKKQVKQIVRKLAL